MSSTTLDDDMRLVARSQTRVPMMKSSLQANASGSGGNSDIVTAAQYRLDQAFQRAVGGSNHEGNLAQLKAKFQAHLDEAVRQRATELQWCRFGYKEANDQELMTTNGGSECLPTKRVRKHESATVATIYIEQLLAKGAKRAQKARQELTKKHNAPHHHGFYLPSEEEVVAMMDILYGQLEQGACYNQEESPSTSGQEHNDATTSALSQDANDELNLAVAADIADFIRKRPTRLEALVGVLAQESINVKDQTVKRLDALKRRKEAEEEQHRNTRSSGRMSTTTTAVSTTASTLEARFIAVSATLRYRCFVAVGTLLEEFKNKGGASSSSPTTTEPDVVVAPSKPFSHHSFRQFLAIMLGSSIIPSCFMLQPLKTLEAVRGLVDLLMPVEEQQQQKSRGAPDGIPRDVFDDLRHVAGLPAA